MSPTSTSEGAPRRPPSLGGAAFLDLLIALATLVVANVVVLLPVVVVSMAMHASGTGADPGRPDVHAMIAAMMPQLVAATIFATLLGAAATWFVRGRRMPSLPALPPAVAYPLAVVAGLLIQLACMGISMLAELGGMPIAPSNADPVAQMAASTPWLAWLVVVLVGPFAEELLFRHVLLRRFALAGRTVAGLVVTALVFAAMHEPVPGDAGVSAWLIALALYAAMATGFGLVYVRTGRFGAAFVAHAACNLVAMLGATFSTL